MADAVVPMGDRNIVRRALPMLRKLAELPAGTKLLWASAPGGEYPVLVGRGLIDCGWWPLESRRFLVSDRSVGPLYGDRVEPLGGRAEIEAGEAAKTLANTEMVLREMARAGATREDHVVALGGGVVGDLAGLVAHLYQRGVPVVQVPTTLVAQVDSAYGGKTGVDLPEGKNYAGAFQQPAAVISDTETLATLPPEELAAGFVEVLKTGLLAGGTLWERVRAIDRIDPAGLDDVVFACARYKCAIVAADELDTGLRNVLNLGHTVGHAIESATGYTAFRHGEAVGLGLLAALRLSDAARPARRSRVDPRPPRPPDPPRRPDRARGRHGRPRPRQEAHHRRRRLRPPERAGGAKDRPAGRPGGGRSLGARASSLIGVVRVSFRRLRQS